MLSFGYCRRFGIDFVCFLVHDPPTASTKRTGVGVPRGGIKGGVLSVVCRKSGDLEDCLWISADWTARRLAGLAICCLFVVSWMLFVVGWRLQA